MCGKLSISGELGPYSHVALLQSGNEIYRPTRPASLVLRAAGRGDFWSVLHARHEYSEIAGRASRDGQRRANAPPDLEKIVQRGAILSAESLASVRREGGFRLAL